MHQYAPSDPSLAATALVHRRPDCLRPLSSCPARLNLAGPITSARATVKLTGPTNLAAGRSTRRASRPGCTVGRPISHALRMAVTRSAIRRTSSSRCATWVILTPRALRGPSAATNRPTTSDGGQVVGPSSSRKSQSNPNARTRATRDFCVRVRFKTRGNAAAEGLAARLLARPPEDVARCRPGLFPAKPPGVQGRCAPARFKVTT
jgi:hypothetical protein